MLAIRHYWLYGAAANWDTNPVVPLNSGLIYDVTIIANGTDVTYSTPSTGSVDSPPDRFPAGNQNS